MNKSEKETAKIIKQAANFDESGKPIKVDAEKVFENMVKTGKVVKVDNEDRFTKLSFNRYVLKGDIKEFWKEETIDGADYFIIVEED